MHTYENEPASGEASHAAVRRNEGAEAAVSLALAAGRTDTLHPAALMHLQRAAGNDSVTSLLGADHEHASVRNASGVMSQTPPPPVAAAPTMAAAPVQRTEEAPAQPAAVGEPELQGMFVQRQEGEEAEEEEAPVQGMFVQRQEEEE